MKSRSFFVLSARTHTQDNLFFINFRPLPNFVTLLFRKEHLNLRLRRSHTHSLHFFNIHMHTRLPSHTLVWFRFVPSHKYPENTQNYDSLLLFSVKMMISRSRTRTATHLSLEFLLNNRDFQVNFTCNYREPFRLHPYNVLLY